MKILFYTALTSMIMPVTLHAQVLNKQSARTLRISKDVKVTVLTSVDDPTHYYYIPKTIQLSLRKVVPEISLMLYRNSKNEITGGILHVLMTWGLTPQQEKDVEYRILKEDSLAVFRGPATITLKTGRLEFDRDDARGSQFEQAATVPVKVPTEAIHKTAVSFSLTASLAQYIHQEITGRGNKKMPQFSALYEYTVSDGDNIIREGEKVTDVMTTDLSAWIKALKQYGLIRYLSV